MNFLGRKLRGNCEGEIVSDLSDFAGRLPGCRIKHRVKENWLKMYDKLGLVLRVETRYQQSRCKEVTLTKLIRRPNLGREFRDLGEDYRPERELIDQILKPLVNSSVLSDSIFSHSAIDQIISEHYESKASVRNLPGGKRANSERNPTGSA
jgi:hypothetical protein